MFDNYLKRFFISIFLVSILVSNVDAMEEIRPKVGEITVEGSNGFLKKVLVHEYPYDTNKMTYEEFMQTFAGKYYRGPAIRDEFMYGDTWISDNLAKIVHKVSPQGIKDLIKECKKMEESWNYYPKIVVLHGQVGSGKTEMMRLVAKRTNRKIFMTNLLIATGYRDSEKINLKEMILSLAKTRKPSIFAIEGAESLPKDCFDVIYNYAKCKKIIFMLEVCCFERIKKKLLGKIDNYCTIEAPLPNKNSRKDILKYLANNMKLHFDKTPNYDLIAKKMKGFSIRRLEGLLGGAFSLAMDREIKKKKGVIDNCAKNPTVTEEDINKSYNKIIKFNKNFQNKLLGEVEN